MQLATTSAGQTKRLARKLAAFLEPGDIISLTGDLGAGKTLFTQGLAAGLEVEEPVTSPTFTIIREYRGRLPLYHFDVYRLAGPADLAPLGYEEYFFGAGVTVIEWGDKIAAVLPPDHLTIELHRQVEAADSRRLIVKSGGPRSDTLRRKLVSVYEAGV